MKEQIRNNRQVRSCPCTFRIRDATEGPPIIEATFAVCGVETELCPGCYEEIAPEAFDDAVHDDVRALINHDTTLVLGRTTVGTLALTADEHGLHGTIRINPDDSDAMNLYQQVKRGDVSQCSFGFDIIKEQEEYRDDGSVKFIILRIKLYEVSICTFPQYEETGAQARQAQIQEHRTQALRIRKMRILQTLKRSNKHAKKSKTAKKAAHEKG